MIWSGGREQVLELKDLALGDIKAPPPLFGDFILDNTLTMLCAPPYTGKSLIMASMIVALDTGLPLFGRFPVNPDRNRVLAVLQDAPTWDYAEQFRKIIRGYGLGKEQSELLESKLIINHGIQITDPKFHEALARWYEHDPFDVVMLDAFWTLHGFNETDNGQMSFVMKALKSIRETYGAAVIFTHHERKISGMDGAGLNINYRSRGATVIPAATDFNISMSRTKNRIALLTGKSRGADEQVVYVDVIEEDHPDGPALKLKTPAPEETRQGKLLLFLAEPRARHEIVTFTATNNPDMTHARILKAVDNDLRMLFGLNKIVKVRHGIWKAK